MWRSICATIAAVWFFAGIVFTLNPLVGFGFLALAFVDWDDLLGDRPEITLPPRDSARPADD
jgi:hypothetical protein